MSNSHTYFYLYDDDNALGSGIHIAPNLNSWFTMVPHSRVIHELFHHNYTGMRMVTLPGIDIYPDHSTNDTSNPKTNAFILSGPANLSDPQTFEDLSLFEGITEDSKFHLLMWAIPLDHSVLISHLINMGISTSIHTPIIRATSCGRLGILKILLDATSDPFINPYELARIAVDRGFEDILRYLVVKGVDIHTDHGHLLHLACKKNHKSIATYLINLGMDPTSSNNKALRNALEYNHDSMVKLLNGYGANLNTDHVIWNGMTDRVSNYSPSLVLLLMIILIPFMNLFCGVPNKS